jgi:hypothetical protein
MQLKIKRKIYIRFHLSFPKLARWNSVTAPSLSLYSCAGFGRPLDSYQDRVTAITEATGNCTLEASPLLQINNTTSIVHKLFIYSDAKYYNFLCKHGVIWPFTILKL